MCWVVLIGCVVMVGGVSCEGCFFVLGCDLVGCVLGFFLVGVRLSFYGVFFSSFVRLGWVLVFGGGLLFGFRCLWGWGGCLVGFCVFFFWLCVGVFCFF